MAIPASPVISSKQQTSRNMSKLAIASCLILLVWVVDSSVESGLPVVWSESSWNVTLQSMAVHQFYKDKKSVAVQQYENIKNFTQINSLEKFVVLRTDFQNVLERLKRLVLFDEDKMSMHPQNNAIVELEKEKYHAETNITKCNDLHLAKVCSFIETMENAKQKFDAKVTALIIKDNKCMDNIEGSKKYELPIVDPIVVSCVEDVKRNATAASIETKEIINKNAEEFAKFRISYNSTLALCVKNKAIFPWKAISQDIEHKLLEANQKYLSMLNQNHKLSPAVSLNKH